MNCWRNIRRPLNRSAIVSASPSLLHFGWRGWAGEACTFPPAPPSFTILEGGAGQSQGDCPDYRGGHISGVVVLSGLLGGSVRIPWSRLEGSVQIRETSLMQRDKGQGELEHCQGELAAIDISLSSTEEQFKQATKERDRLNAALKQAKVIFQC